MELRLRELRLRAGLTQREVAQYLRCDRSLYGKYERGQRNIPVALALRLIALYHVNFDYLVGLTDEPIPYPPVGRADSGTPFPR